MDLIDVDIPVCWDTPPAEILRTIEIAERLHGKMQSDEPQKRIPLLVNSNYYIAYHALQHARALCVDRGLGSELSFCEWGSGLGVVTCIASQLGYQASGIEIEPSLCRFARTLASEANVTAEFIQSSYRELPERCDEETLNQPYPMGPRTSDVVYAYPWPAEEAYITTLFAQSPMSQALLVTYHGGTTLRVRERVLQ
ncbi:hypothetical protein Enr13x_20320 [Stieleria neptunia]|uniref:Uncharacterized protein n=1 Tax=Stieleria neptunia TaxID=2527979 RepID=A0A518HMZ5_9BACT|nr:class I SAM-dependent methyltransferase [Stieleria neptunia]QDV42189.1 hypothetical protein Enr13x_20320 [Stieleria neptunia]